MQAVWKSITTLLICAAVLYLGTGLQVTLLPIRAQFEGFSTTAIGFMGTAFYAGFALGCLIGPKVVERVGHIRCFAGFAALGAAAALAFPLALNPVAWCLLRTFTGLCTAVLYMVVESWLNEKASNAVRGSVLSLYIIVGNLVTVGGQLMVNIYPTSSPALFSVMAMLICLSLVPLSLTTAAAPHPVKVGGLQIRRLFKLSPTGLVGCFVVGIIEGAFWSLAPVFAQGRQMSISEITFFMSAFMVGGTISQWPLGWLSDKIDRRFVIVLCSLGTVGTGLSIALVVPPSPLAGLGLACLHGVFMLPLYALCLAHANDFAPNDSLVETSSGLLLVYSGGAVLGPIVAAPLMQGRGDGALFLLIAALLGGLAVYNLLQLVGGRQPKAVERVDFVPVPKSTQAFYALEEDDVEDEAPPPRQ